MDTESVFPELVFEFARTEPGRIVVQEVGGAEVTAGELADNIRVWASTLDSLGVRAGDTVGSMMETSVDALQSWLGICQLGAIEVPLSYDYRGQYLASLIQRSGVSVIVVSPSLAGAAIEVLGDCPDVRHVVLAPGAGVDLSGATVPSGVQVAYFTDIAAPADDRVLRAPRPSDICGIVFTSGTTGRSKGVRVPWRQLAQAVHCNFPADDPENYDDGAYYCPWPLGNILGKGACDISFRLGLRLVLRDRFSVSNFWPDVHAYRCTHAVLPFIARWIWEAPPAPSDEQNPLRRVVLAPMLAEYRAFEKRFGVRVSTGWATTEAGYPLTTADPANAATCGRLVHGYEVRVADEFDEQVEPGVEGQLLVRHTRPWHQMDGYLNDGDATAAAWRNGWFHTGDSFRYDAEGNYYFTGRMKDYIKHRGHNVSAFEVEVEALSHAEVLECACIGVATQLAGEAQFEDQDIVAVVVRTVGSALTAEDVLEHVRARLPAFMVPSRVIFVAELPKNEINKVDKKQIRASLTQM